eukprot:280861-Chlamydomonas_euryale.AAC.1
MECCCWRWSVVAGGGVLVWSRPAGLTHIRPAGLTCMRPAGLTHIRPTLSHLPAPSLPQATHSPAAARTPRIGAPSARRQTDARTGAAYGSGQTDKRKGGSGNTALQHFMGGNQLERDCHGRECALGRIEECRRWAE